ncbi:hypothetical protein KXD93_25120 [Mucilaginibacter sp. BJC16-A38]|uniref:hypothetical protein n=1 Tax=Mucilaginibacter phenanthrenivorans TaxID=1234842 RepID=UPI0021573232|nr:hypothetical protein [Mucilaginibacter phenanthrenivorans]MCR8560964.1 hypothetical protein [Mucilaginibacter phenanthrenivorans]
MGRSYYYFTFSLVLVLFIITVRIIYLDFSENNSIALDDILAVLLLIFGIRLIVTGYRTGEYIILALILLSVLDLIKWHINLNESYYISRSYFKISGLRFNVFAFLLLVFYCLINRAGLKYAVNYLLHGSAEEQRSDRDKKINFYYDKFNNCTQKELEDAFGMLKDYPVEAQIALYKIKEEKEAK